MEITITGGFGFVGSLCADYFRNQGHKISIVSRKIPEPMRQWSRNFRILSGDVTDKSINIEGDIVIHCAAINETNSSSLTEFMRVNAEGTKNVIESAVRNSVQKFIKVSTFHVYGKIEGLISENTSADPKTPYAISSLAGDNACLEYSDKIETSIIRLSNLFGAPAHPSVDRWTLVVNNFCKQAAQTGKIQMKSKGNQKRDFISTANAMAALSAVCTAGKGGIYNAGGDNVISIREMAEKVAKNFETLYNKKIQVIEGESSEIAADFKYDIEKIRKLGYNPRPDTDRTIKELLALCDRI